MDSDVLLTKSANKFSGNWAFLFRMKNEDWMRKKIVQRGNYLQKILVYTHKQQGNSIHVEIFVLSNFEIVLARSVSIRFKLQFRQHKLSGFKSIFLHTQLLTIPNNLTKEIVFVPKNFFILPNILSKRGFPEKKSNWVLVRKEGSIWYSL